MTPSEFGPPLWNMLHTLASRYPQEPSLIDKEQIIALLLALPILIPCNICANHARELIFNSKDTIPLALNSRTALVEYFWRMHNTVNKRLGKRLIGLNEIKLY